MTLSAIRLASAQALTRCGFCRQHVNPAVQLIDAGITYCGEPCYLARLDELAEQDERGWEPSVSPGWSAPLHLVAPPWGRIAECPTCGEDMGSPTCCGRPSGRPETPAPTSTRT